MYSHCSKLQYQVWARCFWALLKIYKPDHQTTLVLSKYLAVLGGVIALVMTTQSRRDALGTAQ